MNLAAKQLQLNKNTGEQEISNLKDKKKRDRKHRKELIDKVKRIIYISLKFQETEREASQNLKR